MQVTRRSQRTAPGLRQTMSGLHIWVGLLFGWLLYAMFLTGTVSYFRSEISQWMRPEIPSQPFRQDDSAVAQRIVTALATLAPNSAQWTINLPDERDGNASASWGDRFNFDTAIFDSVTGQKLAVRETRGGEFFYYFHFTLHYLPRPLGRWIVGLAAMAMLTALVTGLITHKKIFTHFFTFRRAKGAVSWLDAHNAFAVLGLPFHLMITYTGLVTLMTLYMPWGGKVAMDQPHGQRALTAQLHVSVPSAPPIGRPLPLANVGEMVREAQTRWGAHNVQRVVVHNPGDAAAQVVVVRSDVHRTSVSPQYLLFSGADGKLLEASEVVGPAARTRGVLYALHLGRFADTVTRWLYFTVSLAGTAMVGTGLILWTVKRRQKLPHPEKPYFGFWLAERMNIASIAGLSIAMAAFFWGNRLLPSGIAQRGAWEVHLFFVVWALALGHALVRPAQKAWTEQLWAATVLLALLPVLNALTSERNLFTSISQGDAVFAGFDLTALALAVLHAALAVRTASHSTKVRPARTKPTSIVAPRGTEGHP